MTSDQYGTHHYHSFSLLRSARGLVERLSSAPDAEERDSTALSALLFAAMSVEAFFNDLADMAHFSAEVAQRQEVELPLDAALADALDEVEKSRGSVRLKLLVAMVVIGKPLSKGEEPYQSFNLLFRIRDAMVHARPYGYTYKGDVVEAIAEANLFDELYRRRLISDPRKLPVDFFGTLASLDLCRWATDTALRVMTHTGSILPVGILKGMITAGYSDMLGLTPDDVRAALGADPPT